MFAAVSKVHNKAYCEPDQESRPVHPSEFVHHVPVEEDAEDWNHWHPRGPERAMLSRIGASQSHHRNADDDEGEQSPYIDHLADVVDGGDTSNNGGKQADQDRVLPGRAELRMNVRKEFLRKQAIVRHCVENTRLA